MHTTQTLIMHTTQTLIMIIRIMYDTAVIPTTAVQSIIVMLYRGPFLRVGPWACPYGHRAGQHRSLVRVRIAGESGGGGGSILVPRTGLNPSS
eukprot:COSAG01_NODE_2629_length_7348_cov_14.364414_5_plen_93_part_00